MKRRNMAGALLGVGAIAAGMKGCTVRPAHATTATADAELIAACRAYPSLLAAANDSTHPDLEGPEWDALAAAESVIRGNQPRTIAGVMAKAEAARAKGVLNYVRNDPDPTEAYADVASLWTWKVVNDLLRLAGGAS